MRKRRDDIFITAQKETRRVVPKRDLTDRSAESEIPEGWWLVKPEISDPVGDKEEAPAGDPLSGIHWDQMREAPWNTRADPAQAERMRRIINVASAGDLIANRATAVIEIRNLIRAASRSNDQIDIDGHGLLLILGAAVSEINRLADTFGLLVMFTRSSSSLWAGQSSILVEITDRETGDAIESFTIPPDPWRDSVPDVGSTGLLARQHAAGRILNIVFELRYSTMAPDHRRQLREEVRQICHAHEFTVSFVADRVGEFNYTFGSVPGDVDCRIRDRISRQIILAGHIDEAGITPIEIDPPAGEDHPFDGEIANVNIIAGGDSNEISGGGGYSFIGGGYNNEIRVDGDAITLPVGRDDLFFEDNQGHNLDSITVDWNAEDWDPRIVFRAAIRIQMERVYRTDQGEIQDQAWHELHQIAQRNNLIIRATDFGQVLLIEVLGLDNSVIWRDQIRIPRQFSDDPRSDLPPSELSGMHDADFFLGFTVEGLADHIPGHPQRIWPEGSQLLTLREMDHDTHTRVIRQRWHVPGSSEGLTFSDSFSGNGRLEWGLAPQTGWGTRTEPSSFAVLSEAPSFRWEPSSFEPASEEPQHFVHGPSYDRDPYRPIIAPASYEEGMRRNYPAWTIVDPPFPDALAPGPNCRCTLENEFQRLQNAGIDPRLAEVAHQAAVVAAQETGLDTFNRLVEGIQQLTQFFAQAVQPMAQELAELFDAIVRVIEGPFSRFGLPIPFPNQMIADDPGDPGSGRARSEMDRLGPRGSGRILGRAPPAAS